MKVFLSGAGGRLGSVLAESFKARGDEFVDRDFNYMVFAHRYRGEANFQLEMESNVEWVAKCIERATWAQGDRAIVVVSSVNATHPGLNQSLAYNLSKAALNNLARYYAKCGHRINTVSPGSFTGKHVMISKEEVANVILFLCSPESSGISGQDIQVTRGVSLA